MQKFKKIFMKTIKNLQENHATHVPPTTQNKIIPLEIRSPLSLAISCSAWVHKCMGAQKRERECTGLHWRALTLFFARMTLFCVMDGKKVAL